MQPVPYPYTVECFGPLDGGGSRYMVCSFATQTALLERLAEKLRSFGRPCTRLLLTDANRRHAKPQTFTFPTHEAMLTDIAPLLESLESWSLLTIILGDDQEASHAK